MKTETLDAFHMEEKINQFKRDGYIILRNVLSDTKVEQINSAIDRILSEEGEHLSYNIYNSVERSPEILSLIDQPEIIPFMVNLLGYNIQMHISHLTVRKPNPNDLKSETSSFINWHQDGPNPQFPSIHGLTSLYYVKACYILSDMNEPNRGNTKIIPGSHTRPYFQPVQHDVSIPLEGEMQVCGNKGDVFIFGQNLWHAGAPNHSEFTRRQLFMGYSPLWIRPIDYHKASDSLLESADPIRKQLLGAISDNSFKNYLPDEAMVPLKKYWLGLA